MTVQISNAEYSALVAERDLAMVALARAKQLCDEALPKFNWGASFLDANAIQLLNQVPREINDALAMNKATTHE